MQGSCQLCALCTGMSLLQQRQNTGGQTARKMCTSALWSVLSLHGHYCTAITKATPLRSIMRGTLLALAFCHSRSVAHGSMGSGSVLLSTYDDRRANDLIVKLDNFGFGRAHYACSLDLKGGMCESACCTCALVVVTSYNKSLRDMTHIECKSSAN